MSQMNELELEMLYYQLMTTAEGWRDWANKKTKSKKKRYK